MEMMGNEDGERVAKQSRWGSLAARLEVQCEDVLSMEAEGYINSLGASESRPSQQVGDAPPRVATRNGGDGREPPPPQRNGSPKSPERPMAQAAAPSPRNVPGDGWGDGAARSVPHRQPRAHEAHRQQQLLSRPPPAAASETTIATLKDWLASKKVEKEMKETTSSHPTSVGMSPYEKQHIVKCVRIAHLLVAQLAKSLERSAQKGGDSMDAVDSFDGGMDDWEPRPQDVDEDCITVTEDARTGEVTSVGFDIYRNFDWDHDDVEMGNRDSPSPSDGKSGPMFEALGRLLYRLFMDGEDVPPCNTTLETPLADCSTNGKNLAIPNEDDILDMLRKLPTTGRSRGDGKDDQISSAMRNGGRLPTPLCRLVSDLLRTSTVMRTNGQGSSRNGELASCFGSLSDVHSDIQQMVDFPDAFLFATVTSRWELVFGNNHMFGRKEELQKLLDAAYRIRPPNGQDAASESEPDRTIQKKREAVIVSGHAGSGKSRLVRALRQRLQAQGWLFLRCKFGKSIQSEPLSVIALGLDEYFSSGVVCCPTVGSQEALMTPPNNGCTSVNGNSPRAVCERLERLIGMDGLKCLSQYMPSLCSLTGETFSHGRASLNDANGGLRGKFHTHHLFGTLLDILASLNPVLFFVDDLQWADVASLELLTGLINRAPANFGRDCTANRILFVGAFRTDDILEGRALKNMIQEFEANGAINTTRISLRGFRLESLNEMVSEALCLPRRRTRPLSQIIHLKTQGFPLFVVEFLDALWTEKLLVHGPDGWEWDVDAIDLKGISKSVAELLACRLRSLSPDILPDLQVLSCFGSHVDLEVLEAVKDYNGGSSATMMPSLCAAQREGLVEKAGPTFTFSHDLIQQASFDLIPTVGRVPLLQKLVSCLIPHCGQQCGGSDSFLLVTVDLINKIGSDAVSDDPVQSQLFAQLNLQAGKKSMAVTDFSSAVKHFNTGITFLRANNWEVQYELSLDLFESSALANYSEGDHEQVVIQVNQVLSNAKSFEDKFKSYCVFINVIAVGSLDRAAEKLYDLLRPLGENMDPNAISPQMALSEIISVRDILSGGQKDIFLNHLFQMTDRTKLMAMKLMAMLASYYNRQQTYMGGYLVCKMIRISLQYGHCEDTVFALSAFSSTLGNRLFDMEESYALARTALSLMSFYNADQLIPRIYGLIYGTVLISKDPIQSVLDPLLKACRLAFSNGNFEHSTFNTIKYLVMSWYSGKKIPLISNELNAFAHRHKQQNHMSILQLFLAPAYKTLSALSGISLDSSELLAQPATACDDDIVKTAKEKNDMVFVEAAIFLSLTEAFLLRDFVKASQVILEHQDFLQVLQEKQMKITQFECVFNVGLISFHMARETREAHWIEKGMNSLGAYEKLSKLNEWNFEHKYLLLKAELHHTKGETNAAVQAYDLAVEAAQKHRFIHQVALACELSAHYFGNIGAIERTREMIQRSHDAYIEWGATRKAKVIINLLELKRLD